MAKPTNEMANEMANNGVAKNNSGGDVYIEAPNLIENGMCNACKSDSVDILTTQGIQCWECKNYFHAINCSQDSFCVSANSVFTNTLLPAVTNTRSFSNRFGQFLWMCNYCITEKEIAKTATQNDRVTILDKKIDNLTTTFSKELLEMKSMLGKLDFSTIAPSVNTVPNARTDVETDQAISPSNNVWDNKHKVDQLKQKMLLKSDKGIPLDPSILEKTCVDNGVAVLKSYKVQNSEDTVIIVNSLKDAEILKKKLGSSSPQHVVSKMATRPPTIIVTGLDKKYEAAELIRMIKLQNKGIGALLESGTSDEDKKIDVVAVNVSKTNSSAFKATVRVSNAIRALIAKQNDRLFVGYKRVCNVWDSYYVSRCFKCQEFGHQSRFCEKEPVCSHCAGSHDTRQCRKMDDVTAVSCINCTKSCKPRNDHAAYYINCPVLKDCQDKLKSTIPFYQSNH